MTNKYAVKVHSRSPVKPKPHPHACNTSAEFYELAATIDEPKVADLFCGAGGMSLGLEDAGFASILGVDYDDYALETYRSLFPGLVLNRDLSDEDVLTELCDLMIGAGVSVVVGGPPCQPFSRAGRSVIRALIDRGIRDPYDHRRDLWQSFLEVVARVQPSVVIMENVPDLALGDECLILRLMVEDLERQGYSVEVRLIDAWRYGVPQHRKRLILVALSERRLFRWPPEAEELISVGTAIGDLPALVGGWDEIGEDGWIPYDGPVSTFQKEMRRGIAEQDDGRVYDHVTRAVREDDLAIFRQMDSSTLYSEIDDELKRYRDDIFSDRYNRLEIDGLSRTIIAHIAKDGYGFIHPTQDRTISVRETARLQTFPDRVRFAGPPTAAFRQIGNAVPPRLAYHIGVAVVEALESSQELKVCTSEISSRLAGWYSKIGPASRPWLALSSIWSIAVAEALLSPTDPQYLKTTIGEVASKCDSSTKVEAAGADLRSLAGSTTRSEALEQVVEAALNKVVPAWPDQRGSSARLVALASREVDQDVLYTMSGVLRVVARFFGSNVDKENSGSDGRVSTARMVGVNGAERPANLALVEIAQSICVADSPRCEDCPLNDWCVFSRDGGPLSQPSLWSQESQPR